MSVHGSQNVRIGGQGHTLNATMDIEKMISVVDSADASVVEKEEAKSLLKKISKNPLVKKVLFDWIKRFGGGT